jgi:regulator of nucleoside diphosphate kinase
MTHLTPPITITRPDLVRLEQLLERLDAHDATAEALERELGRAEVVGRDDVAPGTVTMRSTARCRDEGTGQEYRVTLAYPHEAGREGTVSVLAPVGFALLGLSVGQTIDWDVPGGRRIALTVLGVDYQPEAAGDPL